MKSLTSRLILWSAFGISLLLGLWLRASYDPEWLQVDEAGHYHVWLVEADCYERLVEVQHILRGDGLIQRYHLYENWPQGVIPSTTAPLDYLILLLDAPLKAVTAEPLIWAGVLVSPLLWAGLALFWTMTPLRQFNRSSRIVLIFGSAFLPGIIWATAFGRPDHQSLILALMAVALTAEFERWEETGKSARVWHLITGLCWGLMIWTSLYEPLIIFMLSLAYNLIFRHQENPRMLIVCGSVLLLALGLEGVHIFVPTAEQSVALKNWSEGIAELRGMSLVTWLLQHTVMVLILPFLAWRTLSKPASRHADVFIVLLTLALVITATGQGRWACYSNLAELLVLARYFAVSTSRWRQGLVGAVGVLALLYSIFGLIDKGLWGRENQPSPQIAQLAGAIDRPGGVLAPWWLSSGISYFSGQPIVACSSHTSIAGIIDTARFYTSSTWSAANAILRARRAHWVVVWDDPQYDYPLLNNSRTILGQTALTHGQQGADDPLAPGTTVERLIHDRFVPKEYRLASILLLNNLQLKLYEFTPENP